MASRQEEKERRRKEREEREAADRRAAANRRRLQLAGGGVVLIAVIAVVVVLVAGGGGGSDAATKAAADGAPIPARKISDFDAAVAAAGCTYKQFPMEGRTHLASDTAIFNGYKTNPPTSGNHRPTPAQDGVYAAGNPPDKENSVHSLEHGRIEIQYSASAPALLQRQLLTLYSEPLKGVAGYHQLLFRNQTNMPYEVAATAWTRSLTCKTAKPEVFDAIRAFRVKFVDKGPELIP